VLARETYYCAARARNPVEVELLTQGLHDNPDVGRARLQSLIDAAEAPRYGAVVLGYGLCSNMIRGLRAGSLPLVVPRAHDCITLLLGSKERYTEHFRNHPGSYYYSAGWLEYPERGGERMEITQKSGLGPTLAYEQLVAKYGEENARYLAETMGAWSQAYTHGVLIEFEFSDGRNLEHQVQEICRGRGWAFARLAGELSLLQHALDGEWSDQEFLVLDPGEAVEATYDDCVIRRAPAQPPSPPA